MLNERFEPITLERTITLYPAISLLVSWRHMGSKPKTYGGYGVKRKNSTRKKNVLCFCFHLKWVDCDPLPTLTMLSVRLLCIHGVSPQRYSPDPWPLRPAVLRCTEAICASKQLATKFGFPHLLRFIKSTEPLIELRTRLHLGLGVDYEECKKRHIEQTLREPWRQSFHAPSSWSQRASPSRQVTNQEVHRALLSNDFTGI